MFQIFHSDVSHHEATLNALKESGAQLIEETPTKKPAVDLKLQSLNDRFNDLDDKSKSRLADMEKGLPLLDQFNKLYNESSLTTRSIREQQSREAPVGIAEEVLMHQVSANATQKGVVDGMRSKVSILSSLADQIVDLWTPLLMSRAMGMMNGDAYESSVDLPAIPELNVFHEKVERVTNGCKEVESHTDDRYAAVHDALAKVRLFKSLADELDAWLSEKEIEVALFDRLSADPTILDVQKSAVLALLTDINDHKPSHSALHDMGTGLISGREPSDHVDAIQLKMDGIQQQWNDLNARAGSHKDVVDAAIDYKKKNEPFVGWLGEQEEAVTVFEPVCLKIEKLQEQMKETEVRRNL